MAISFFLSTGTSSSLLPIPRKPATIHSVSLLLKPHCFLPLSRISPNPPRISGIPISSSCKAPTAGVLSSVATASRTLLFLFFASLLSLSGFRPSPALASAPPPTQPPQEIEEQDDQQESEESSEQGEDDVKKSGEVKDKENDEALTQQGKDEEDAQKSEEVKDTEKDEALMQQGKEEEDVKKSEEVKDTEKDKSLMQEGKEAVKDNEKDEALMQQGKEGDDVKKSEEVNDTEKDEALMQQGNEEEEVEADDEVKMYSAILSRDPGDMNALKCVLYAKMRRASWDGALRYACRLREAEPGEVEWRLMQAQLHELRGDLAEAERQFRVVLAEDPLLIRALHVGTVYISSELCSLVDLATLFAS